MATVIEISIHHLEYKPRFRIESLMFLYLDLCIPIEPEGGGNT